MNASEIRKLNADTQAKGLKSGNTAAHEAALKFLELTLLAEIAAQLAEFNQEGALNSIAIDLEKIRPRWVWLPLGDGVMGVFDATKIANVRPGSKPNVTVINDSWREECLVFMSIAEVCDKLRIPMEG